MERLVDTNCRKDEISTFWLESDPQVWNLHEIFMHYTFLWNYLSALLHVLLEIIVGIFLPNWPNVVPHTRNLQSWTRNGEINQIKKPEVL